MICGEGFSKAMGQIRLLVVDDSTTMCALLNNELTKMGYIVAATHSMEDAIELCDKQEFSLVLSDLVMPGMGGIKGIQAIRKRHPRMPVIAMTGVGSDAEVKKRLHEARMVGADALMTKPFDVGILKDVVEAQVMPFAKEEEKEKLRRRILVIDDSSTMCMILLNMLSQYGYQATAACSIEEAYESDQIIRVDVIVLDIFMPGKGGIQGIAEIRANWPNVKIIAMSGGDASMAKDDVLKAAKMIGADKTMKKPFDATTLVSTIESLLIN